MKHLSPVLEHTASSFTLFLPLWVCWRQRLQRRSPRRPRQQAATRWEAARFLSHPRHTQDHPTYTRGIQSPPGDKRQQDKVPAVRHSSQPPLTNYPARSRCHNRQDDWLAVSGSCREMFRRWGVIAMVSVSGASWLHGAGITKKAC